MLTISPSTSASRRRRALGAVEDPPLLVAVGNEPAVGTEQQHRHVLQRDRRCRGRPTSRSAAGRASPGRPTASRSPRPRSAGPRSRGGSCAPTARRRSSTRTRAALIDRPTGAQESGDLTASSLVGGESVRSLRSEELRLLLSDGLELASSHDRERHPRATPVLGVEACT